MWRKNISGLKSDLISIFDHQTFPVINLSKSLMPLISRYGYRHNMDFVHPCLTGASSEQSVSSSRCIVFASSASWVSRFFGERVTESVKTKTLRLVFAYFFPLHFFAYAKTISKKPTLYHNATEEKRLLHIFTFREGGGCQVLNMRERKLAIWSSLLR